MNVVKLFSSPATLKVRYSARSLSVLCPSPVRSLSVLCPSPVRSLSVPCPSLLRPHIIIYSILPLEPFSLLALLLFASDDSWCSITSIFLSNHILHCLLKKIGELINHPLEPEKFRVNITCKR